MPTPLPPKQKNAKGILWLFLLLIIGGGGYFAYQKFFANREPRIVVEVLTRYQKQEPHMGTLFAITVYASSEQAAEEGFTAAFARAREINQVASDYLPDSELSLLNAAPADEWQPISKDMSTLLAYGIDLADLSGGAYDPTLGTLTHLWRETKNLRTLPSTQTLREARSHTGWKKVEIQQNKGLFKKNDPQLRLDLGGIAKGYAADEMLAALALKGIRSALVVAGGDVRCGDSPPDKPGWTVGLKDDLGELSQTLTVSNCAVSTSGDLHQFVEIEGRRFSHIIDPVVGLGLEQSIMATVVASRGLMTDPLATAACTNPRFVSELSPSTDIHSRILLNGEILTSSSFPKLAPIAVLDSPEEEAAPASESTPG